MVCSDIPNAAHHTHKDYPIRDDRVLSPKPEFTSANQSLSVWRYNFTQYIGYPALHRCARRTGCMGMAFQIEASANPRHGTGEHTVGGQCALSTELYCMQSALRTELYMQLYMRLGRTAAEQMERDTNAAANQAGNPARRKADSLRRTAVIGNRTSMTRELSAFPTHMRTFGRKY